MSLRPQRRQPTRSRSSQHPVSQASPTAAGHPRMGSTRLGAVLCRARRARSLLARRPTPGRSPHRPLGRSRLRGPAIGAGPAVFGRPACVSIDVAARIAPHPASVAPLVVCSPVSAWLPVRAPPSQDKARATKTGQIWCYLQRRPFLQATISRSSRVVYSWRGEISPAMPDLQENGLCLC